jgi:hypothetical protein
LKETQEDGDADNAALLIGQDAGLIHDIPPTGEIVERRVAEHCFLWICRAHAEDEQRLSTLRAIVPRRGGGPGRPDYRSCGKA